VEQRHELHRGEYPDHYVKLAVIHQNSQFHRPR
jgi:hypothetical protein